MSNDQGELHRPPRPMTRQEKLEEIRRIRAELRGEAQKESKS
jgi:hypothetical protein